MTNPEISVIIPFYNVESLLSKCLDSVINQTFQNIEIILINDGSTDKSPEIAENYAQQDPRIKIIHQDNSGQSIARNAGLKIANGEYISFVDSDDWIDLKMYEELLNQAKQNNNPDIIRCNLYTVSKTGNMQSKTVISEDLKELIITGYPSPCTGLWKRDFLEKNSLYFEEGLFFEDTTFFLKAVICANKFLYVPIPYYFYNFLYSFSTTRGLNKKFLDLIKNFKIQTDFLIAQNLDTDYTYSHQTRCFDYFQTIFKRALMIRGIKFWHYHDLKQFFDEMHDFSKNWKADKMNFTNRLEKQKFKIIQEKNFLKFLAKTLALDIKIKTLWKYVIKNKFD